METKIKIELGNGVEVSIPVKTSYSAAEFVGFFENLSRGVNAMESKFSAVATFQEPGKKAFRGTGRHYIKYTPELLAQIQSEIDAGTRSMSEIEKYFGMPEGTTYALIGKGKLKKKVNGNAATN